MPDRDTRRLVARIADARLSEKDADRYAEITAGLKAVQIASILTPPPASEEEASAREAFIAGILGAGADVAGTGQEACRAHGRLAAGGDSPAHRPLVDLGGHGGRGSRSRAAGRGPPHRTAQAGDPRARVLRAGGIRRARTRLRGRRRDGGGQEGPRRHRREHPRRPHHARADGHPVHGSDGHGQDVRRRGIREGMRADDDQAQELPIEMGGRHRGQPREDPERGAGDRPGGRHRRRRRPGVRQHGRRGGRRAPRLA